MNAEPIWNRAKFYCSDIALQPFPGRNRKLNKPFCWTPNKPFLFGNKRFIALYPCIAFETINFGFVIQKRWDGMVVARE